MLDRLIVKGYSYRDYFTGKTYSGPIDITFKKGINYVDPRAIDILSILYKSIHSGSFGLENSSGYIDLGDNNTTDIYISLQYNEVNYYELILSSGLSDNLCVFRESFKNSVITKTYDYLVDGWDDGKVPPTRTIPLAFLLPYTELLNLSNSFTYLDKEDHDMLTFNYRLSHLQRRLIEYYNVPTDCINIVWSEIIPKLGLGIEHIDVVGGKIYMDSEKKHEASLNMIGSGANLLLRILPILFQKDKTIIISKTGCNFTELHPMLVKHLIKLLDNTEDLYTVLLEKNEFTKY